MDGGGHHRPIDPQLPAPGALQRPGQAHDLGEPPLAGRGLAAGRPAAPRGLLRHRRDVDPAALPPHQARAHPARRRLVSPPRQGLHHQQAPTPLHRGGRPPVGPGPGPAVGQVRFDRREPRRIVQHASQWRQDRVQREAQGRDKGEHVHGVVTIPSHRGSSLMGHSSKKDTTRGERVLHRNLGLQREFTPTG